MSERTVTGKVLDYGIGTSKAGNPMINATIRTEDGGTYNWIGSFKEGKAREITLENLTTIGLKSPSRLGDLPQGKKGGAIDLNREFLVTLGEEEYNGKTSEKIKYLNPMGALKSAMSQGDFATFLATNGIQAEYAAKAPAVTAKVDDEEIPF